MPFRRLLSFALVPMLAGMIMGAGCIFSPEEEDPEPIPEELLPRTSQANVIHNLQVIYNDKVRSALERRQAYEQLLPPDGTPEEDAFLFFFQPADIANGLPASWPKSEEIAAHQAIFDAQEAGDIYSIELRITASDPVPLNPQQQGREDWTEISATNVYLRVMFNIEDGLEVNGGQAEYRFAPPVSGLYVINEWTDLPRP
jgi:hypothetical protein